MALDSFHASGFGQLDIRNIQFGQTQGRQGWMDSSLVLLLLVKGVPRLAHWGKTELGTQPRRQLRFSVICWPVFSLFKYIVEMIQIN